jgi:Flp pilus assembly protein TadG
MSVKAPPLASVRRRPARLLARREHAQSMVEFALALPIFVMLLAATVQLSVLLTAQISMMWVTNSMARWIASGATPERWYFRDSCHNTYRTQMINSFPLLRSANVIVPASPNYITPANTNGFNSPCYTMPAANPSIPPAPATQPTQPANRARGSPIRVTLQYNPSNLMFIPTTFFGIPVLNTLPAYTATAVME